jgi:hypothetical protein
MIAYYVPGFSAGNWQIPLTNNNLNASLIGVDKALTFFGAEQTGRSFYRS